MTGAPAGSLVLAVDTSSPVTSVALARADLASGGCALVAERADDRSPAAEVLATLIEAVLGDAGAGPRDLAVVAVGTGPGPFTGLRAGIVTASLLARAAGAARAGVTSLDALAHAAATVHGDHASAGGAAGGAELLVATDARRREVYWATYRLSAGGAVRLAGPAVAAASHVPAPSGARVVVGRGAVIYADVLGPPAAHLSDLLDPPARAVAELAVRDLAAGAPGPLTPQYLRRPDAREPGPRKRVLSGGGR